MNEREAAKHNADIHRLMDTIAELTTQRDEARAFIIAEYRKYHKFNPYVHTLRSKYSWLEAAAAER